MNRPDLEAEARFAQAMGQAGYTRTQAPTHPVLVPAPAPIPPASQVLPPLRDGQVHLGDANSGGPLGVDLAKLVDGRLLIQGNSGAGKSMLLRRLFEQAFGKIQQLVIDPDGEFITLSEVFDVVVLPAAEAARIGGRALALHLREHRYSAVLDLSEAATEERLKIVAEIAAGLIEAPVEHWHPLLVLVDEAQTFAPHYDTGEVEKSTRKAAIGALADLMGRGRKRGLAGVIATQRPAETSKAVTAKATNIIVGRTIYDRDIERAGASIGFTLGHSRSLRTLADGEFLCMGPALAGARRVRFRAGPVQSRHKGTAPRIDAPPTIAAAESLALLRALPTIDVEEPEADPSPRKKGPRGWSKKEDAIVAEGYRAELPILQICDKIEAAGFRRRALSGICSRARILGLASAKAARGWSDEEDRIVTEAYVREVRIIDIAGLLATAGYERGRVAIQMRAIALGITRDRVNYWAEPEKKIAIAGLDAGKPNREILADLRAAGFERGVTSISKFAQKHNFNRKSESWTPEEIETLRQRYAAKVHVREIAQELGRTVTAVRARACNLGLKQRTGWTEEERRMLEAASDNGERLIDVTARIGRPYCNVAAMAKRMGLSFRPPVRRGSEAEAA